VLGRRLRGAMPKVKAALAALSSDEVRAFKSSGTIEVAGQTLTTGDLTVSASVDFSGSADHHGGMGDKNEAREDAELIVVLDIRSSPELVLKGLARGFISAVQQLRKKAGLRATDDAGLFYRGASERLEGVIGANRDVVYRETRCAPGDHSQKSAEAEALVEEEVEIADEKVVLVLVRL
jgi:isoleucyl-tRNA synthetase